MSAAADPPPPGRAMPVQAEDNLTGQMTAAQAQRECGSGTSNLARFLRKLHLWLGVLLTMSFLVLIISGLLVQHRTLFSLADRSVSRRWLPSDYRPHDPDTEIRADIVLTDLHSGKLFGPGGRWLADAAAGGLLLMIASGFGMQIVCRYHGSGKTL